MNVTAVAVIWESHNTKNNKIIIIKSVFSHNSTGTRNKLDPDNSANLKPPQLQRDGEKMTKNASFRFFLNTSGVSLQTVLKEQTKQQQKKHYICALLYRPVSLSHKCVGVSLEASLGFLFNELIHTKEKLF